MFVYGLTQILDIGFNHKMVSYVLFREHMNKFMANNHQLLPLIQVKSARFIKRNMFNVAWVCFH